MRILARFKSWFRSSKYRSILESSMDDELRFHLDRRIEDLVRGGMSLADARRRAGVELGAVGARKDEMREAVGLRLIDDLRGDLRYSWRMLRQSPGFAVVAILSLALGIGANTAIFTLMEAVLWRPVGVKDPQELRLLANVSGPKRVYASHWGNSSQDGGSYRSTSFSYAVYEAFRKADSPFASMFGYKPLGRLTAIIDGVAETAFCHLVSGNLYQSAEIRPQLGRALQPSDDSRTAAPAVVLSDAYWHRRFAGSADVLGRKIVVNDVPLTVIGVNPPGFTGFEPGVNPDFYLALSMHPVLFPSVRRRPSLLDDPDFWWLLVMGRLKPGATDAQAQVALDGVLQNTVQATLPGRGDRDQPHVRVLDGVRGTDSLRFNYANSLTILLACTGLVMLLACANVASLLLARASARQREISLRLALGARWGRLARQLLSEGLLLALIAGVAGTALGYALRDVIPSLLAESWAARPFQGVFGWRVLLGSLAVTLLTGVLFSLAPAWQSRKVEANAALKDGSRASTSLSKLRAGRLLVVFQVFLGLVILSGASLAVRTLTSLKGVALGFDPRDVMLFQVNTSQTRHPSEKIRGLVGSIREQMEALPGVKSATFSLVALLANSSSDTNVTAQGQAGAAYYLDVGERFFETMGIRMIEGRAVGAQDRFEGPKAVVVNQEFARRFFPGQDALGKVFANQTSRYEIVGVAADARYENLRSAPPPTFYSAASQVPPEYLYGATFEVKFTGGKGSVEKSIRELVKRIDPEIPVIDMRTQEEQIDATVVNETMYAALTSAFGFLGLTLTCVGIYGLMNHTVARRTGEIGIRMALGARASEVLGMILRETGVLVGVGIGFGAIGALAVARAARSLLFGVEAWGVVSLAVAALTMVGAGVFAAWWPARRASRVDPMVALRHE